MSNPEINISPATGVWTVRSQGAVIAETSAALELREGDLAPVIYIPRDDLQMVFFDASTTTTTCPHKGVANYFHLIGKNRKQEDVAWSYESPLDAVKEIKGHLAFDTSAVTVEMVN